MRLFFYGLNSILALLLVLLGIAALVVIVGDAVIELWGDDRQLLAILALIGVPITLFVWPWTHEAFGIPLWPVLIAGVVAMKMAGYWLEEAQPKARADLDLR